MSFKIIEKEQNSEGGISEVEYTVKKVEYKDKGIIVDDGREYISYDRILKIIDIEKDKKSLEENTKQIKEMLDKNPELRKL